MSYSIAQVRNFDLSAMHAAKFAAQAEQRRVDDAVNQVGSARLVLLSDWTGGARDAADANTGKTHKIGAALEQTIGDYIREIGVGADALEHARSQVLSVVSACRSAGFDVNERTGQVKPNHVAQPHGMGFTAMQAQAQAMQEKVAAEGWQVRIEQALQDFEQVDAQVAGALGSSPDVTSAQQQAIIAQVDAGHLSNPLAALQIPWSAYTKRGQTLLAQWAANPAHHDQIGLWIAGGKKLNFPPSQNGYEFDLPRVGLSQIVSVSARIIIPAAVGVSSFVFNKTGAHPTISGDISDGTNGALTPSLDNEGGTVSASVNLDGSNGNTEFGTDEAPNGGPEGFALTKFPLPTGASRPGEFVVKVDTQPINARPDNQPQPDPVTTATVVVGTVVVGASLMTGIPEIILVGGGVAAAAS